jgi:hypothetical protein
MPIGTRPLIVPLRFRYRHILQTLGALLRSDYHFFENRALAGGRRSGREYLAGNTQ